MAGLIGYNDSRFQAISCQPPVHAVLPDGTELSVDIPEDPVKTENDRLAETYFEEIIRAGTTEAYAIDQMWFKQIDIAPLGVINIWNGGDINIDPDGEGNGPINVEDAIMTYYDGVRDTNYYGLWDVMDGMAFQKLKIEIVDSSGLKVRVQNIDEATDCYFWLDGEKILLDTTTAPGYAEASLTAGADENTPVLNYIYIIKTGGVAVLTVSTTKPGASTGDPAGSFCWVGKVLLPDSSTWGSTGAYAFQRFTESFQNDTRGAHSHEREKIRELGAQYSSGISHSLTIASLVVHLEIASGVVYQLHRQTWPETNTGPYYYGNGTSHYTQIDDLGDALFLEDGSAITTNKRYNLIIWGAINITTGECKVFVNLPNGTYNVDSQAIADINNTVDTAVPIEMHSVAFMIARVCLKYTGSTFVNLGVFSLLGQPPGVHGSGHGSTPTTEFVDTTFRLFDGGDSTKEIAFEASGIDTGTTRTMTMPNMDFTPVGGGGAGANNKVAVWNGTGAIDDGSQIVAAEVVVSTSTGVGDNIAVYDTTSRKIKDGGATIASLTGVTGSGTDNQLAQWNGTGAIDSNTGIVAANVVTSASALTDGKVVEGSGSQGCEAGSLDAVNLAWASTTLANDNIVVGVTDGSNRKVKTVAIDYNNLPNQTNYAEDSSSSGDDYATTVSPTMTAYRVGMVVYLAANRVNTGACTLNIDSLGAKDIKLISGADPDSSDINTTVMAQLIYDGTSFILANPQ